MLAPYGATGAAAALGRTPKAIKWQAQQQHIPLATTPSEAALESAARRLILDAAQALTAPLCVVCAARPATMPEHGVCRVCWLTQLVECAQEHEIADVDMRQYRDWLRQRKCRERKCVRCGRTWWPRRTTTHALCDRCR